MAIPRLGVADEVSRVEKKMTGIEIVLEHACKPVHRAQVAVEMDVGNLFRPWLEISKVCIVPI